MFEVYGLMLPAFVPDSHRDTIWFPLQIYPEVIEGHTPSFGNSIHLFRLQIREFLCVFA
jgi:hypothetical protein